MPSVTEIREEYITFINTLFEKYGTDDPEVALGKDGKVIKIVDLDNMGLLNQSMLIEIYGQKALFLGQIGEEWGFVIINSRKVSNPNVPSRMIGTKEAFIADLRRGVELSTRTKQT